MFCDLKCKKENEKNSLTDIEVTKAVNFSLSDKIFLEKTLVLQEMVLGQDSFQRAFLKESWTQTYDMNNAELWDYVVSGKSNLTKMKDNTLDYFLTIYSGKKKTIGYTLMSSGKIFVNKYWFQKWKRMGKSSTFHEGHARLSSHLFHEYLHSCGFSHRGFFGSKRKTFVYKAGYLMRDQSLHFISNFYPET